MEEFYNISTALEAMLEEAKEKMTEYMNQTIKEDLQ